MVVVVGVVVVTQDLVEDMVVDFPQDLVLIATVGLVAGALMMVNIVGTRK